MGITRRTKSLKILLGAFVDSNKALSVVDLVKRLENDMNKTTVYRLLERLEDEGELHSFIGKDGLRWVARCPDETASGYIIDHPHFQCRDCGKSECLTMDISLPSLPNRKIDSANLLLIGTCADCLS